MTTYTLLCSNSHGAGNPVTAEIYAGLDIPVAVTEEIGRASWRERV